MSVTNKHLNIAIRFLSEIVTRVVSLIIFTLMAKYLGPEGYGVYVQTGAINGLLIPIATIGLGFSVVRLIAGKKDVEYISARFFTSLLLVTALSGILTIIVALLAPLLNNQFIKIDWVVPIIHWSSPLIICTAITLTIGEYYRARLRVIAVSLFQIFGTTATVVGIAIVLNFGDGLLEVIKVLLFVQTVQILLMIGYLIGTGEIRLSTSLMPRRESMDMIRFGIPIIIMGIGTWVFGSSDRLVIGFYLNASEVGVYNAAYVLAAIPAALAAPFWYTLYPLMAAHKNNNDAEKISAICRKYSRVYFCFGIPALLGITVLSSEALFIIGTGKFVIHPVIFGIIATGLFGDQFTATAQYLIFLHNEPKFFRNITLISGLLNIALNIVLVPSIGLLGAAVATLVSYLFLETLVLRRALSYGYRFRNLYDINSISKIVISAFAMAAVVYGIKWMFQPVNVTSLTTLIFIGAIAYAFILYAINGFDTHRLLAFAGLRSR